MKKYILRIAAILLMMRYYLPIVPANIKMYSLFGIDMFAWLWIMALIIFGWKRVFSVPYLYLYFFALVYIGFTNIFWFDLMNYELSKAFRLDVYGLFISISIYDYFISAKDFKGLSIVIVSALVFIGLSLMIDISVYFATGLSSRAIWSVYITLGKKPGGALSRLGNLGLTYYYGISFIIPILVAAIKVPQRKFRESLAIIVLLSILLLSLAIAEYVTALLIGVLGFILSFLGLKRLKTSLIVLTILIIVLYFAPKASMGHAVDYLSSIVRGDTVESRLDDLSLTTEQGLWASDTHTGRRAARIPFLIQSFLKSPFLGGGPTTEHSYFLDRLSMFGIMGLLPWLLLIRFQFMRNYRAFNDSFKFHYLLCLLAYITMGITKGIPGIYNSLSMFLLIPGTYYLVYRPKPELIQHNIETRQGV